MTDKFSFSHFVPLHNLTQLISSSSSRFVLVSSVSSDAWTVHIGLAGEGRWWEGYWSEEDILAIARQNNSSKHLKAFAQRLETTIFKGELGISGWDPSLSKAEDMQFVLNPSSKKPLRITLREMSAKEAARFTVKHFVVIAEEARTHGCRLFGTASTLPAPSSNASFKRPRSPSPPRSTSPPPRSLSPTAKRNSKSLFRTKTKKDPFDSSSPAPEEPPEKKPKLTSRPKLSSSKSKDKVSSADLAAQNEIEKLRRELARARSLHEKAEKEHRERERDLMQEKSAGGSTDALRSRTLVPAAQRRPGASLANPNQKARRYQAVEFEDDSN